VARHPHAPDSDRCVHCRITIISCRYTERVGERVPSKGAIALDEEVLARTAPHQCLGESTEFLAGREKKRGRERRRRRRRGDKSPRCARHLIKDERRRLDRQATSAEPSTDQLDSNISYNISSRRAMP